MAADRDVEQDEERVVEHPLSTRRHVYGPESRVLLVIDAYDVALGRK